MPRVTLSDIGHAYRPIVQLFPSCWYCSARQEDPALDPYALLIEHPDITLVFADLPAGERGRWYPDLHVIMLHEGLTQAERRCTLTHELVHRMRGDSHAEGVEHVRQERSCHNTVARLLIPFPSLLAAMQWGRDPQEIAEELWVDVETLHARIHALSPAESAALTDGLESTLEETA